MCVCVRGEGGGGASKSKYGFKRETLYLFSLVLISVRSLFIKEQRFLVDIE